MSIFLNAGRSAHRSLLRHVYFTLALTAFLFAQTTFAQGSQEQAGGARNFGQATAAALYRMRGHDWFKGQAQTEQQSYGFGSPEKRSEPYAFAYATQPESSGRSVARVASMFATADDEDKESKSKKDKKSSESKKKDDEDDDEDDKESDGDDDGDEEEDDEEKSDEEEGEESDDGGDNDKEDENAKDEESGDEGESESRSDDAEEGDKATAKAGEDAGEDVKAEPAGKASPARAAASLSADAGYISLADAIKRARAEGGSGEVLQIDLEWDAARSVTTWDITFSSGTEYELDAASGKRLAAKPKSPTKLAALAALDRELSGKKLLTFEDIIRKAEAKHGQPVMEMELKRIKARSETLFEVVLGDGTTLYYNAETGNPTAGV
ncbi:MAG TPA: PepSY domain-containing protein [Blastocatellia bacterium]|nr:PepSY domain-containing protein [Blastocatellia bacterium]